ncbi:hypothetical protein ACN20G_25460 [Streptomyces sp. BI20]|uniref:hypothetical protein n=1 Tax=Streptomyces sp. BI20 TaxID=3403460 RepID=UPI003C74BB74
MPAEGDRFEDGFAGGVGEGFDAAFDSGFDPTHVVPREGLATWESPDVARPSSPLDPFLPVRLTARQGDWAEIRCANGWTAWVDGRLLVAVPTPPPTAGRPVARAEDPRPPLTRTAEALARYREAAEALLGGRIEAGGFRRETRALRAGVVIDGESVWIWDPVAGRWLYGDGAHLTGWAVPDPLEARRPRPDPGPPEDGDEGGDAGGAEDENAGEGEVGRHGTAAERPLGFAADPGEHPATRLDVPRDPA